MMATAKQVLTAPGFDKEQLELIKANFVTSYDRRYDTPAKVLSALKAKVNYAPNARMWDANAEEYKSVTVDDVKRLQRRVLLQEDCFCPFRRCGQGFRPGYAEGILC